jgi:hypothetical protein
MSVGRLHHDLAADNPVVELLELGGLLADPRLDCGRWSMFWKLICKGICIGFLSAIKGLPDQANLAHSNRLRSPMSSRRG